jgi:hypothetical protein
LRWNTACSDNRASPQSDMASALLHALFQMCASVY